MKLLIQIIVSLVCFIIFRLVHYSLFGQIDIDSWWSGCFTCLITLFILVAIDDKLRK